MKNQLTITKSESNFFTHCYPVETIKADKLITFRCNFEKINYRRDLFASANIKFPASLNKAVIKRQAEYLAGRYVAALALAELGFPDTDIAIGKHRSPIWPDTIVASITHTHASALCTAAFSKDVSCLGVDLETWLRPSLIPDIKNSIISKTEDSLLRQCDIEFDKAFTLTFSAKESLFKALYPTVGYYFDFMAAEITFLSLKSHRFVLTLRQDLSEAHRSGACFTGYFSLDISGIRTLVVKLV